MAEQPIRVLVTEHQPVFGHDLCDTVAEAGYVVEGPFEDLSSAMLSYQKNKPDIAILGVQLGDGIVYPFAERMMAEDVTVIFHSQQMTQLECAARYPNAQSLAKPSPDASNRSDPACGRARLSVPGRAAARPSHFFCHLPQLPLAQRLLGWHPPRKYQGRRYGWHGALRMGRPV